MFGETPLVMIEDDDALLAAVDGMRGVPVIGVDTEADSFHSYQEKVCLVQLSDLKQDYIVDPLKVKDMSPLGDIMADPATVKVLHGADYDIVSLKRDFGFQFDIRIRFSLFTSLPLVKKCHLFLEIQGKLSHVQTV